MNELLERLTRQLDKEGIAHHHVSRHPEIGEHVVVYPRYANTPP